MSYNYIVIPDAQRASRNLCEILDSRLRRNDGMLVGIVSHLYDP